LPAAGTTTSTFAAASTGSRSTGFSTSSTASHAGCDGFEFRLVEFAITVAVDSIEHRLHSFGHFGFAERPAFVFVHRHQSFQAGAATSCATFAATTGCTTASTRTAAHSRGTVGSWTTFAATTHGAVGSHFFGVQFTVLIFVEFRQSLRSVCNFFCGKLAVFVSVQSGQNGKRLHHRAGTTGAATGTSGSPTSLTAGATWTSRTASTLTGLSHYGCSEAQHDCRGEHHHSRVFHLSLFLLKLMPHDLMWQF
jgi:hypothetical protein